MLKKILCAGLAAALLVAVTGCGGAKDKGKTANTKAKWPKNVEVVVPYGAGGDTDFNARLLSQKLSKKLGTNIVVPTSRVMEALPDPGRSRMGRKTAASSCSTTRDLP